MLVCPVGCGTALSRFVPQCVCPSWEAQGFDDWRQSCVNPQVLSELLQQGTNVSISFLCLWWKGEFAVFLKGARMNKINLFGSFTFYAYHRGHNYARKLSSNNTLQECMTGPMVCKTNVSVQDLSNEPHMTCSVFLCLAAQPTWVPDMLLLSVFATSSLTCIWDFTYLFIDVCVFVFLLQIRTRAVSCKQMTMVNPLQLLMFSQSKVESENGIVRMDDW